MASKENSHNMPEEDNQSCLMPTRGLPANLLSFLPLPSCIMYIPLWRYWTSAHSTYVIICGGTSHRAPAGFFILSCWDPGMRVQPMQWISYPCNMTLISWIIDHDLMLSIRKCKAKLTSRRRHATPISAGYYNHIYACGQPLGIIHSYKYIPCMELSLNLTWHGETTFVLPLENSCTITFMIMLIQPPGEHYAYLI